MLTHVNYRTGRMHDMAGADARGARRRRAGGLGPRALGRRGAGRPAPATTPTSRSAAATSTSTAAPARRPSCGCIRATRWIASWRQPLSGWIGHAAPFDFTPDYRPAARHRALPLRHAADAVAGRARVRRRHRARRRAARRHARRCASKSLALTDLFIALVEARCAGHGLTLVTPRDDAERGSQVCFAHAEGGYAIMQALIARGVIGDFRRARHPALRFHAALHRASSTSGTPSSICARCCNRASGASRASTSDI